MCSDAKCPSRMKCYRFVATPSPFMQAYGSFGREVGTDKCDHFWPTDNKVARNLNRALE